MTADTQNQPQIEQLAAQLFELLPGCDLDLDWPLGQHTSYRVGGSARLALKVGTPLQLARLARFWSDEALDLPLLVLGGGTNMLVADEGFKGLLVRLGEQFSGIELPLLAPHGNWSSTDDTTMRVGPSLPLPIAARQSAAGGLGGFEWAVGVPGSVGGAVRMNAGGHGSDISQNLISATCVDMDSGLMLTLTPKQLQLGYRTSALSSSQIVCSASFRLHHADPQRSRQLIADILSWRREHQPGGQNCGSVFANTDEHAAGALVDQAGLKGNRVGSARVSAKHANFIIADRGGRAQDIFDLMCEVSEVVHAQTGIRLRSETVLVGFDGPRADLLGAAGTDGTGTGAANREP